LRFFTGGNELERIITLRVFRTVLSLRNETNIIGYLNLDRIEAMLPGSTDIQAEGYELELKSERNNFPEAEKLQDYLRNAFGMIPITRSKARRLSHLIRARKGDSRPHKVILDMDTGVDDALAIILAMNSPEIEVLGITTVSGNIDAKQAAKNTVAVLNIIRPNVSARYPKLPPVANGVMPASMLPDASDVHGPDGLGGVSGDYFTTNIPIYPDAQKLFTKIVNEHDTGTITLITTGPLSNVALWIENAPQSVGRLKQIISMGGVFFESGNRSQAAEFNIHADPASARKVVEFCREPLSSSRYSWHEFLPLVFIGLDVTHKVCFRMEKLKAAHESAKNKKLVSFIDKVTRCYMDFYYRNEGLNGCYLHDPLAVGYVIDPSLLQVEQYHVEVGGDQGYFTSGITVADYRPTRLFKDKMKEVTWIGYKVDSERFEKLFFARVLGI